MIETYYRILKHDSAGKLVKDTGLIESHSYVIQFLELIYGLLVAYLSDIDATDTANAETRLISSAVAITSAGRCDAAGGDDAYGIVVGTNAGPSAEDNLDFDLDTRILHSAVGAADKLNYQAVTFQAAQEVGANVDVEVTRTFVNETGGGITVKEIGLITKQLTGPKYHLMLRDVVADELVADGETLTVIYILRTTV